jgi:hypothetical protein
MLTVRDLHAYYGKSHILQGVSLDVGDNEIVSDSRAQRRWTVDDAEGDHGRSGAARRGRLQGPADRRLQAA